MLAFFAVLAFLLCAAGHRRGSDEIVPNWLDRVPLDLLLVIFFCLGSLNVFVVAELNAGGWIQLALIVALCIPLCLLVLAALMTLSTRLKLGKFWENTSAGNWDPGGRCARPVARVGRFHILPSPGAGCWWQSSC